MSLKKIVFFLLLCVNLGLVLQLIWGKHGLLVYLEHRAICRDLEEQLLRVQKDNLDLSRRIRLLKTDAVYQQQTVRKELHVVGDREILYLIKP